MYKLDHASSVCLGLQEVCGTSSPGGDYASSGRYVTFRFVNTDHIAYNKMSLVFTAFHTGIILNIALYVILQNFCEK